jgi:uncharacterized protein YciI
MDFDRYTVVLLVTPEQPPELSEEEADRLQDAHLAHLAHLRDEGVLVAAGPVWAEDEEEEAGRPYHRGISIMRCDVEEALRLKGEDPAVQAGVFELVALPWLVPAGAIVAGEAMFPRSMEDV